MVRVGERQVPTHVCLAAATAAVTVPAVWLYLRKQRRARADYSKERAALAELSRRFFHVCRNLTDIAKTVRTRIKEENTNISEKSLVKQLTMQYKVVEKLQEIEEEVAREFGCTITAVKEMQQELASCPEVRAYTEGFKKMLDSALAGKMPILANVQIPKGLTEERVLDIERDAALEEVQKAKELFHDGCTYEELGTILQKARSEAWESIFAKYGSEIHDGSSQGVEVYYSAVATYMEDPAFVAKMDKLDAKRQRLLRDAVMKAIKTDSKAEEEVSAPPAP